MSRLDVSIQQIQRSECEAVFDPASSEYRIPEAPDWGAWQDHAVVAASPGEPAHYQDSQVDINRGYRYRFHVVDGGGNASGWSPETAGHIPQMVDAPVIQPRILDRMADTPRRQTILQCGLQAGMTTPLFLVGGTGPLKVSLHVSVYSGDLCIGGTASSNGDAVGYPAINAFDNNGGTAWRSLQSGPDGQNARLVYELSIPRSVFAIDLVQSTTEGRYVSGIAIDYSSDGITWYTLEQVAVSSGANTKIKVSAYAGEFRYWSIRPMAGAACPLEWEVFELAMYRREGLPLVLSLAGGFNESGSEDWILYFVQTIPDAWTLPPSSTCYLYVDRDPSTGAKTFGYTTVPPLTVGYYYPDLSYADGQHFYNYIYGEMRSYEGGVWRDRQRIFVGCVITDEDSITEITCYALMGHTCWRFPLGGAVNYHAHYMGATPARIDAWLVCTTAELGYSVGERVGIEVNPNYIDGATNRAISVFADDKEIMCRFTGGALMIPNRAGGWATLAPAKWMLEVYAWDRPD